MVDGLLQIGVVQASILELSPVNGSELRKKIEEILVEREAYVSLKQGLITKNEFANLILDHFQTLLCRHAGVDEPKIVPNYVGLVDKILELIDNCND